jgi:hypothetical protein
MHLLLDRGPHRHCGREGVMPDAGHLKAGPTGWALAPPEAQASSRAAAHRLEVIALFRIAFSLVACQPALAARVP